MSKSNPAVKCTANDNENRNIADGSGSIDIEKHNPGKKQLSENINIEDPSEGTDSGFLSGPQSCQHEEAEEVKDSYDENNANNLNTSKSNIVATERHTENITGISQPHDKSQGNIVVDSGCIEEEEYEELNDSHAKYDRHLITKQQTQNNKAGSATAATKNSNLNEEMKLKHDIDIHILERFCNLGLQIGTGNNLNVSSRISTVQSTGTSNISIELTQQAEREKYFQQNDDGNT